MHTCFRRLFCALVLAQATCTREPATAGSARAQTPVHVTTSEATHHDLPIYVLGLGTAQALYTTTVRSQVDGRLAQVHFTEGSEVACGAPLADLDLRPFAIAVRQAEATLRRDEALWRNYRLSRDRTTTLADQNLVAQGTATDAQALVDEGAATVAADQAALAQARLQLEYAHIVAPIAGRTGMRLVDPGNLLRAGDANGLVVITQVHPITVVSTLPEDELPKLRRAMAAGPVQAQAMAKDGVTVEALGAVLLIDNSIDAATGTLRLKSTFANDDDALWPGKFLRTRFLVDTLRDAVVVPEQAVQHGAEGPWVYVVDAQKRAQTRKIQVGESTQLGTQVTQGLVPGERVVTEGQFRLHAGSLVVWDDAL